VQKIVVIIFNYYRSNPKSKI